MSTAPSRDVEKVVRLPGEGPPPEPPPIPSAPGRLHGLAIAGMGVSALIGVAAVLAFITITWPADMSRYVIGIFFVSGVMFLVSASTAVFSAARDTYRNGSDRTDDH